MENEALLAGLHLDQVRKGHAARSIEERDRCVGCFARWLGHSLLEATRDEVEGWLDSCELGVGARRNYLVHVHQLYVWAADAGYDVDDPTKRIHRPKQRKGRPHPVSDDHVARAIATATNPRLRCFLLLAAYGGLRCVEIAGLRAENILIDGELLLVHGKGDKERLIPLHPLVAAALDEYGVPEVGPVFVDAHGRAIHAHNVSQSIAKHIHRIGLVGSAHKLRHTFATTVYRSSHDLLMLRNLLGHESVATTQIYADFDGAAARAAVTALHYGASRSVALVVASPDEEGVA